jgi:murein tripeptide amidase MpaA
MNRKTAGIAILAVVLPSSTGPLQVATAQDAAPAMVRFDGHKVVRVTATTSAQADAVAALSGDVWTHGYGPGVFDVRIAPGDLAALDALGVTYEVLIPNLQSLMDSERAQIAALRGGPDGSWFQTYHPWDEINQYLADLAAQYPELAETFALPAATHEGRAIYGLRITGPGSLAARPAVLFNGCQHAREWISPATVLFVATRLLEDYDTDPRARRFVDGLEFIIVPVVNPDGYAHTWTSNRLWRKNRRDNGDGTFGVDLNRNWSYRWGGVGSSPEPGSDLYRGPAAFSEPETQGMRELIRSNERIRAHIDFHSYRQLVLSPWAFTPDPTPDAPLYNQLGAAMAAAIQAVHGKVYTPGPWYSALYPSSGVMIDWMYFRRDAMSWTMELRDTGLFGFILPPEQIVPTGEENLWAMRALLEWVGPIVPGDLNCDGALDAFDVEPFVTALVDPSGYATRFPDCDVNLADLNFDGAIDAFDIDPFVGRLSP